MKREIGDQMFFDDLPEETEVKPEMLAYERDDCSYCSDFGPCMYCERGKQEALELKKQAKGQKAA